MVDLLVYYCRTLMIAVDDDNEAMKMAQMQDKNKQRSSFL